MRRVLLTLSLLILTFAALVPGAPTRAWQQSTNLLENPSFEGSFFPWSGMNEVQVAHGWTPWWRTRTETDPPTYYFKPEFKQANGYVFPNRIHGGASAQQWFTFHATHQAGMYQQVFGVTPGVRYHFTIWAQVWSSTEDDASVSRNPAYPNLQVGIDPTGGWNPWSGTIVWSGTYAFYDSWGQLGVDAVAQSNVITVFMRSEPNFPVKHNDMYWDDAALVVAGQPIPPPPTNTPAAPLPPTNTPAVPAAPTNTPAQPGQPTNTPAAPPMPTATCAPAPSDWVTYYVQKGDTLYSLSKRSGTTVTRVMSVNCLHTTTIHVGQALLLPRQPDTPTPPVATHTPKPAPPTATAEPTKEPTAVPSQTPSVTPTGTASLTPTRAPTRTPSRTPTEPPPTVAPPTATSVPEVADTATPTQPPATIPPPSTSTPGPPTPQATSTPSGSSTRPCGTIYVGAGIVLLAGAFRFRRRGR